MSSANTSLLNKPVTYIAIIFLCCIASTLQAQRSDYVVPADSTETADSSKANRLAVYLETFGHNYAGYCTATERMGYLSINVSYRQPIFKPYLYLTASLGFGYTEYEGISEYYPVEASIQAGKAPHFFEVGCSQTFSEGDDMRVYGNEYGPQMYVEVEWGTQAIPRLGYVYAGKRGLYFRASYTPRFYPKIYDHFGVYDLQKPRWINVGASIGWTFF